MSVQSARARVDYASEAWTEDGRGALAELVRAHGIRGVLTELAAYYAGRAKDKASVGGQSSTFVRTSHVLAAAYDSLPLQVR